MKINYLRKHTIPLIAVLTLGVPFSLACADQNPTAKTSSRTVAFVTTNAGATYGGPKTDENIRNADEQDEQLVNHFGWHGNPPLQ
jgi:hypothetical protein